MTPNSSAGITSSPNNKTNQCTGRTNSPGNAPQRIRLGIGRSLSDCCKISTIKLTVSAPFCSCLKTNQVPLSVSSFSKSSTLAPHERAKPCSAFVGLPSSSNAALIAGPRRSTKRSCWRTAKPSTITAIRRGAAYERIALKFNSVFSKPCLIPASNA